MPSYDYVCESKDKHVYTEVRSINEDQKITKCPECKGALKRVFESTPVIFAAPGFYAKERKSIGL
jgi:putative FmdB family regulatory protein